MILSRTREEGITCGRRRLLSGTDPQKATGSQFSLGGGRFIEPDVVAKRGKGYRFLSTHEPCAEGKERRLATQKKGVCKKKRKG